MNRAGKHFYEFGSFRLDTAEQLLLHNGQPVSLKPKIFDLLLELVANSSHILTKDELMKQIWPDSFVEEHNLAVSISTLRKALGEDHNERVFIETVPRRGYRFIAGVKEVWNETADLKNGPNVRTLPKKDAGARVKSIAVLPLKHIGAKATELEYLGLGLADALITRLSNLRRIAVRPTSAVRKYDSEQDPVTAGRELQVSAVLEGSVQRSGRRIRVTVQLVSVHDGASLWAGKFDETFTNIFAVEDSISEHVARALMLKLTDQERKQLRKRSTESAEAYQAYLKGRYFWNKRTPEGFKKGISYFERAIELDPNYALAHAGLADCYHLLTSYVAVPSREVIPKAKAALLKALELDETLAEAHTSLARLRMQEWDWLDAEREFLRAIELNPNYPTAHHWYSCYLRSMGRFEEALAETKTALDLDPVSLTINTSLGTLSYLTGQYDQALEQLWATVELDPNHAYAYFSLGIVYATRGTYDEGIKQYQKTLKLLGRVPELTAYLGHIYALSGRKSEAQKTLNQLTALSDQGYELRYYIALIHLALGDKDQTVAWLEKAYDEREAMLGMLKVDPLLDSMRSDPRFTSLEERVGLAPKKRSSRTVRANGRESSSRR